MKDSSNKIIEENPGKELLKGTLLVKDLLKYFSNLSKLNEDPRTGNKELSEGLRKLIKVLKPYSNKPLEDITEFFGIHSANKRPLQKVKLPENLDSLSENEVEDIMNSEYFQKLQLVELGVCRFGISKSKLERLNKEAVIESIRSALDHERSIGVISEEAKRSGQKRSS